MHDAIVERLIGLKDASDVAKEPWVHRGNGGNLCRIQGLESG